MQQCTGSGVFDLSSLKNAKLRTSNRKVISVRPAYLISEVTEWNILSTISGIAGLH